ncbi:DUF4178 domain-containing protein [Gorillibacterium massiliense]|uniref:DUF4178 domain-containing protein n=1 Tax=Gorillibacterium massiliense TaxID=1280390 RepID=UPI0004B68305|nr:DUF4178 domain-containing protein [Gorillibacterium massiliense]
MSFFKRVGSILRSQKQAPLPAASLNPFEESKVGDIVAVNLVEYVVTGKAVYFDPGFAPHRFVYYIRNGRDLVCLLIEKGRSYDCYLCEFVEGFLNDPLEVPSQLDVDGEIMFNLESNSADRVRSQGNTDFRDDEVSVWRYFSANNDHFFLQWQDGKFVAMQGEQVPTADVQFLRASVNP